MAASRARKAFGKGVVEVGDDTGRPTDAAESLEDEAEVEKEPPFHRFAQREKRPPVPTADTFFDRRNIRQNRGMDTNKKD